MTTKLNKKFILGTLLMLMTATALVACGDTPTATPGPAVSTTAAASATTAASGSDATTAAGNAAGAPASGTPGAGAGRGQGGFNVATGTVQSYDATSKSLTVMDTSGTSQTFDATNAIINKNAKITLADLGKETLATDIIQVTGTKGTDGSYTATALTVTDPATMANGGFPGAGANGTPGAGGFAGRGGANGTPGANAGTPGAGRRAANGTPGANAGTPGANGGFGGGANGGNRVMLTKATLSGNTLTGTDQTGASVTVNLSDSTAITKRTGDTATDLAAGAKISVNFRAAQNNGAAAAVAITIEQ